MILYHTTDQAESILKTGFRDNGGKYLFVDIVLTGVFLSDRPVDVNEGAKGDQVLRVSFRRRIDLDEYELVPEGIEVGFREWCVPAALINENADVRLLSDRELEDVLIEQLDPEIAERIRTKFPHATRGLEALGESGLPPAAL